MSNKLPASVQERIKADAERFTKDEGYQKVYIAGATAWAETAQLINIEATITQDRAQALLEALEKILKQHDYYSVIELAANALQQWKEWSEPQVELSCMVCGTTFMGPEPKMCCSGRDCGCMGLPVEPIVCSEECYNKGLPNTNPPK